MAGRKELADQIKAIIGQIDTSERAIHQEYNKSRAAFINWILELTADDEFRVALNGAKMTLHDYGQKMPFSSDVLSGRTGAPTHIEGISLLFRDSHELVYDASSGKVALLNTQHKDKNEYLLIGF